MKNQGSSCMIILLLATFINFPGLLAAQDSKPTKHALVIAISNYKGLPDWAHLSSDNDLELLKQTLDNIGFKDHVDLLKNEKCTKEGIKAAIRHLTNTVKPGDIVLLHYSGHGTQIEDESKKQGDNLDESWVPIDASIPHSPDEFRQKQSKYLRGPEIRVLLDSLRLRLGKSGDLLVLVDACCSAGSTRGRGAGGVNRGLDRPIVADPASFTNHKDAGKLFKKWCANSISADMCDYVVIAAARAQEADQEIEIGNSTYGPLSYAFAKAVSDLNIQSSKEVTYSSLFESIKLIMNQNSLNQMPEIDGTAINKGVFGGKDFGRKRYFNIRSWDSGKKRLVMDGGTIQGVTVGSKVGLYKISDISNPTAANELVEGRVDSATFFTSYVRLDTFVPTRSDAVAIVRSYSTNTISKVVLGVKDNDKTVLAALKKHFEKNQSGIVSFSGRPDLLLSPDGGDKWSILVNGLVYKSDVSLNSDEAMNAIDTAIEHYTQYHYLQNVNLVNPHIHAKVEIISYKNGKIDSAMFAKKNAEGTLSFDTGTALVFHLINDGDVPVYVNLVDMSPNGDMAAFLPYTPDDKKVDYYPVAKCFLKVGEERYYFDGDPLPIGPPFGNEIIKVFVTKDQMDLEDMINTRGATTRDANNLNTLGKIFKKSFDLKTRGLNPPNASFDEGTVYGITFEIKDPANKQTAANK